MKKKIEKKQKIAIVISIVIGIIVTLLINFNSQTYKVAFTETKPTQEEYDILKEYALKVVEGSYEEVKDINVEKIFEEDYLKIKVEKSKLYGIESNFPIFTVKDFKIENGSIKYEANIDSKNATSSEYALIKSKTNLIFADLLLIPFFALIFYIIFYWSPKEWKKQMKK